MLISLIPVAITHIPEIVRINGTIYISNNC
jgi:hypothetical protein